MASKFIYNEFELSFLPIFPAFVFFFRYYIDKREKFGLVLLVFTLQCLALVYFFLLFQKKDNQSLFAVFSLAFNFVFNMTYNLSINMKSPKPERRLGFNLITIIICNH